MVDATVRVRTGGSGRRDLADCHCSIVARRRLVVAGPGPGTGAGKGAVPFSGTGAGLLPARSGVGPGAGTVPGVIDLHTHSTVSDGSDAPERIVELAAAAGLSAVALTDHDRLDGVVLAARQAAEVGVELVPGCELSCEHSGTMHLLVYFPFAAGRDLGEGVDGKGGVAGAGPLQDQLVRLQRARDTRNQRMAAVLGDLGLPITYDEIEEQAGGIGAGRPHIAAILVRKGIVGSVQEAFDTWLAKGRPAYVDKERLEPGEALRLARASGATPVLAHPRSLDQVGPQFESTIRELADLGLVGVEAIYGRYSEDERTAVADVARRCGLVVTGGSDYHGTYKPDLEVGIGRGDLAVPDAVLDELRDHAVV